MNSWRGISATLLIVATLFPATSSAMVVGSTFANTTVPTNDQGDLDPENDVVLLPEWYNVGENKSSVYLGDNWVLTADHAFIDVPQDIIVRYNGIDYQGIPGSNRKLHNPAEYAGLFPGLSSEADIQLFRIKASGAGPAKPDLPDLTIAESMVPNGGRVVMIGRGTNADPGPSSSNPPTLYGHNVTMGEDWTWSDCTSNCDYYGQRTRNSYPATKRWGTNIVYDSHSDSGVDASILNAADGADQNENGIPDVFKRTMIDHRVGMYGTARDFLGVMTKYLQDSYDFDGDGFADEAQPTAGDSGGAVFYERNGEWELAGLMHAVFQYPDQLSARTIYGNWAVFSDLSVYRPELSSIMTDEWEYSDIGDLNLDGAITGSVNSSGGATGDLAMFVEGWMHQQAEGDIISWQKGDLTGDGATNFADLLLMRDALQASGNAAAASQLLSLLGGNTSVPEPSTLVLVLVGYIFLMRSVVRRA